MDRKTMLVLVLLAALNFTHILDFMIMMPLANYLMPFFDIQPKEFSFLVAVYPISAGISSFVVAFFVNKFDRKKVLIFAYIGFLIGTFSCGLVNSYWSLLTSRIVAGIFGGMIMGQIISIVSDLVGYENRGKAMGIVLSSFAICSALGVPFALYVSGLFDWHAPFLITGTLGLIVLPFLFLYIPSFKGHLELPTVNRMMAIKEVLKDKQQYLALLFSYGMMVGHFMIIPLLNPFLEFNLGFDKKDTLYVYFFGGVFAFLSAIAIGRLSDQYGKFKTYTSCLLLAFPCVLFFSHVESIDFVWILVIMSFWFFVSSGRSLSAQAMISNVGKQEFRGSFQSFNSFVQQLGMGTAMLLSGFIVYADSSGKLYNYNILGYISIVVLSITIVIGYNIFGKSEFKKSRKVEP